MALLKRVNGDFYIAISYTDFRENDGQGVRRFLEYGNGKFTEADGASPVDLAAAREIFRRKTGRDASDDEHLFYSIEPVGKTITVLIGKTKIYKSEWDGNIYVFEEIEQLKKDKIMKRIYKRAIFTAFFALAWMILPGLSDVQMIFAQTEKQPVRKIDRKKMNTSCNGNFLAGARRADGSVPADVENLSKIYDFDAVKKSATKNRFKITDERMFVPVRMIQIEEFNRDYNSGAPFKKGDAARQIGALRLVQAGDLYVELQGRVLEIEKRIAAEEKWILRLNYVVEGRDDYPQEISVSQQGRCNLSEDYIRARAKQLLDSLGIESDWTSRAGVLINFIN